MAKQKEINLKEQYQKKVYRFVSKELSHRNGGIVLADGVGLGKTYEALASVASLLSRQQHGKIKKIQQFKVLIIVPPGLVSKWAEEIDKFTEMYLEGWKSPSTRGVVDSFKDVVILRRFSDLYKRKKVLRFGKGVMPSGIYIMNSNLLYREGKKVTAFHRTNWNAVIVDEAHHLNIDILSEIIASKKTATMLLTATPFQLSPQEMKALLAATYGGYEKHQDISTAFTCANELYNDQHFRDYRKSLNDYFHSGVTQDAKAAEKLRTLVSDTLRPRIIRNKKKEQRCYHFVNEAGNAKALSASPFSMNNSQIDTLFRENGLIKVDAQFAYKYLSIRNRISDTANQGRRTFTAVALRQLLSSWEQFKNSASGKYATDVNRNTPHPKVDALVKLVGNILKDEISSSKSQGFVGKILVFTTYVGDGGGKVNQDGDKSYGTAKVLADKIRYEINKLFSQSKYAQKQVKEQAREKLLRIIDKYGANLQLDEKSRIEKTVKWFAGSRVASLLLSNENIMKNETAQLKRLLKRIDSITDIEKNDDEERRMRQEARRSLRVSQIIERYSTRRLVVRYDGAIGQEEKDRHLHGFNSPFAPLVMIVSSVGQEGIDLQQYCRHVIHYDLEWNPAKLEQREGRVDRIGRKTKGAVNVYFLLCRSTYDERMYHVMINRQRWHRVLLANRTALAENPDRYVETQASEVTIKKLCLNLEPR